MGKVAEQRVEDGRELKKVLKSMALWEDYRSANLRCEFCGVVLSQKNLASLFAVSGRYGAGCNLYDCYKYFLGLSQNRLAR